MTGCRRHLGSAHRGGASPEWRRGRHGGASSTDRRNDDACTQVTRPLKDPELYESLRDDGASKEKAARIANAAANTSRSAVGRKGGKSGDYDDWTKDDLMKRAREIGIEGRSSMSKAQLVKALRNH